MLEIGSVVDGKYKILNKVGQGGMSVVYLAMNERANKQWAIKEVRKDGSSNFEVVRQGLIAEVDILKKLNHPTLPSIVDVIDDGDSFLIVMDYIEGNDLKDILKEYGAQPQEYVIEWAKQLCDVLDYLHTREKPIIYRDMKPSNIKLKPDGNIMLFDFGTAREYKEGNMEDTTCLGTRGYAAPEQYGGHGQTDARTDIYCLGATLYHLVTGHNPSEPPYAMYPIRQWNPALSAGLEQIILKCTRENPEDRYASCTELLYALEHYDELDEEYRGEQKRKMTLFAASAGLTVLLGLGAVFGKLQETHITNTNYSAYVRMGKSSSKENALECYEKAININPSEAEAYMGLLDAVEEDDGILDAEEDLVIRTVLNDYGNRKRSNESYFAADEKNYTEFSYRLALDYWYTYEGSGNKNYALKWFDNVMDSKNSEESWIVRSNIFSRIGNYYSELGKKNLAGDSKISYEDYWNDLKELSKGDVAAADNEVTALRLYNEMVYQIATYAGDFKAEGISKEEMENQLESMQVKAGRITAGGKNSAQIEELKQKVDRNAVMATQAIQAAYEGSAFTSVSGGEE